MFRQRLVFWYRLVLKSVQLENLTSPSHRTRYPIHYVASLQDLPEVPHIAYYPEATFLNASRTHFNIMVKKAIHYSFVIIKSNGTTNCAYEKKV